MSRFHTTLGEVHMEYARANKAAKDMVEACKRATTEADGLHTQCSTLQKDNDELSDRL